MSTPTSFLEKIKTGTPLVADGATGTNLLARGLPSGVLAEAWVLENPAEIRRLHQDFIDAGADIILTCTFSASPLRLKDAEMEGYTKEVNYKAVQIARQTISQAAVERQIFIAGSLGPVGQLLKPYGPLDPETVFASYAEQAQNLDEAGADLLVIETQYDLGEATQAVNGVRSVSSLPLVCSFSYDRGTRTMMGVKPEQVAGKIGALGVDMLGVNCGRSLEENLEAFKELRSATDLPLWFKPNAGLPELSKEGTSVYSLSPDEMGDWLAKGVEAGAQVAGGCCGTSPNHLAAIASKVKS